MILRRFEVRLGVRGSDDAPRIHRRFFTYDGARYYVGSLRRTTFSFTMKVYDRKKRRYVGCSGSD